MPKMEADFSPETLAAIAVETRACFLEEDVPGYLESLAQGLEQLRGGRLDFKLLMHAAHSLKGGAAISQLLDLSSFAHDLEDLLETLSKTSGENWSKNQTDQVSLQSLTELLSESIEEISSVLAQVQTLPSGSLADLPINHALKQKLKSLLNKVHSTEPDRKLEQTSYNFQPQNIASTPAIPSKNQPAKISYLRIPTSKMEAIANIVGELLVSHERLVLQQQQLTSTNQNLRQLMRGVLPIQDQVQTLYDQLAINQTANLKHSADNSEFDPLELDHYQEAHQSLQDFQETFSRIREANSDLDLGQRELSEQISQLRQQLDSLYSNLTKSRLVPFRNLAQRFKPQLKRLCQEYQKSVELEIEGEEVLIDQVILEQLQTPLNHLLVNAFDHGIEFSSDRLSKGKSANATIRIKATIQNNQVEILVEDDGCGIDLVKVHQKAIAKSLIDSHIPFSQWRREDLLQLIFQPQFSTANQVSQLSGRGMGLDIVQQQIKQLRGSLRLNTVLGQGTSFIIRLPLGLSLIPLLICQLGDRLIGIPSLSVLAILATEDLEFTGKNINWRTESIPLFSLSELLAFGEHNQQKEKVCLILGGQDQPFAVTIEKIQAEKPLILKPLDRSIPTPAYLAGCTVLGTGRVIPVILPGEINLAKAQNLRSQSITPPNYASKILIAEDSITTRQLLERTIKQIGIELISCRDGQEAWDLLSNPAIAQTISLVISDIEMPRLNGFELLQRIRSHNQIHALPVVVLTSRGGDRHRQKALSSGVNIYLTKPFNPKLVLSSIQSLLAQRASAEFA
ncbi:MAG: response regulator [Pseudanabaenaceae cyanobacterium bins.68]|nr:response regulator [Pseudanabaenaceae cyanobacterium bins.68]